MPVTAISPEDLIKQLNGLRKVSRPEVEHTVVPDGIYGGTIDSVEARLLSNTFYPDGRPALLFKVSLDIGDGETADLHYPVTLTWSRKGNMVKLLEELGLMPEPGKDLDFADFEELPVSVTVENAEKDGVTYSNIIYIKKRAIQAERKPSGIRRIDKSKKSD